MVLSDYLGDVFYNQALNPVVNRWRAAALFRLSSFRYRRRFARIQISAIRKRSPHAILPTNYRTNRDICDH